MRSILLFAVVFLPCVACASRANVQVPPLAPVSSVNGTLYDVPELGIRSSETIDVPTSEIPKILNLAWPTEPCDRDVGSNSTPIARLEIIHANGSTTELIVGWTGHNLAAVSLEDGVFFYGGLDDFPDGATRIARLLREYCQQ